MHHWLVPNVVFPLIERLAGRRMWSEACRLREAQWWPQVRLEALQLERLRRLVTHATTHVPHYREVFARAGMRPDDIRTLSDLSRVPVTSKRELREGFPDRTTASNLPRTRRQQMTTSGSTGLPFTFYWDLSTRDMLFGAYLFSLEWAGVALWDTRIAVLIPSSFATNTVPPSRLRTWARRIVLGEHGLRLPADSLTSGGLRTIVAQIRRGRRYFIRGYPSAIAWLAQQLANDEVTLAAYPAVVITYAESLTDVNAHTIRHVFGCPVVNCYTSWDIPHIAQSCPDNPAVLHIHTDRVIVRIVRPDGHDAGPGEPGRVVVTDLANWVMPFVNYAVGDSAVRGEPCPCGRGLPTLTRVEGRDTEVIQTGAGRQISGVVLGHFLAFVAGVIPYVLEYQAQQTGPDAVVLRVVPTTRFTTEFGAALQRRLSAFLGPDVSVAIEVVDAIPIEPSGKRLIIKPYVPADGRGTSRLPQDAGYGEKRT